MCAACREQIHPAASLSILRGPPRTAKDPPRVYVSQLRRFSEHHYLAVLHAPTQGRWRVCRLRPTWESVRFAQHSTAFCAATEAESATRRDTASVGRFALERAMQPGGTRLAGRCLSCFDTWLDLGVGQIMSVAVSSMSAAYAIAGTPTSTSAVQAAMLGMHLRGEGSGHPCVETLYLSSWQSSMRSHSRQLDCVLPPELTAIGACRLRAGGCAPCAFVL